MKDMLALAICAVLLVAPAIAEGEERGQAGVFDFSRALLFFGKAEEPENATKSNLPPLQKTRTGHTPLNGDEAARYRKIFALQETGEMKKAAKQINALTDFRLYGHVLHQRYMHPTAYQSSFAELKDWLTHYADHPHASDIYDLALRKMPQGFDGKLQQPRSKITLPRRSEPTMVRAVNYKVSKGLEGSIRKLLRAGKPGAAFETLNAAGVKDKVEYDIFRARIAAGYLYQKRIDAAFRLASQSAARSGDKVPLAGWIGGLSAWLKGDYKSSARLFEQVANSKYASAWTQSAGAYWAARAYMRRGDVKKVSHWLNTASEYPRTFYGLVATRALGQDFDFNWQLPVFGQTQRIRLAKTPQGHRALALMQIGQITRAQSELIRMDVTKDADLREAALAYAAYAKLPSLSMRLGSAFEAAGEDRYFDAALYPILPWSIPKSEGIDPALVHAIVRQESRFDPSATSHAGAQGLMQLMPATAKAMGGGPTTNPANNLKLGQTYLAHLLEDRAVDNELFNLLIAYNAGPGNLRKWQKRWPEIQDPLLFVELIPAAETRGYVERVLSNYWIYRMRDNEPTPSLNAVTTGRAAKYAANEDKGDHVQTALAE